MKTSGHDAISSKHVSWHLYTEMWIIIFFYLSLEFQKISSLCCDTYWKTPAQWAQQSIPSMSIPVPTLFLCLHKTHLHKRLILRSYINLSYKGVVLYTGFSMFTLTVPLISPRSLSSSTSVFYSYSTEENSFCFSIKAPSYSPKPKVIIKKTNFCL